MHKQEAPDLGVLNEKDKKSMGINREVVWDGSDLISSLIGNDYRTKKGPKDAYFSGFR